MASLADVGDVEAAEAAMPLFGPPAALNTNAASDSGSDYYPQVTTDEAGAWVVVWESDDSLGGTIGADYDILVSRSTDAGGTWTAPLPLNANAASDSGIDYNSQVTTDGAGAWVAVWWSNDSLGGTIGTDYDILFASFSEILDSEVVGRHVFYNNSKWDAHAGFESGDPAANAFDDAAIATDKTALLPGQTATAANYTSYQRGINGVMVDIEGLADSVAVADGDFSEFTFKVGNDDTPGDWSTAADPTDIDVRDLGGGVHRVTFLWADNAIPNKNWLQVTVLANAATGLAENDVFYFGSTIGENTGNFAVDYADAFDVIWPLLFTPDPIGVDHPADVNRDGRVDYSDVFDAVWPNLFAPAPLEPITAPAAAARLESTDSVFDENLPWEIELIWFDELRGSSSDSEEEEDDALEATTVDGVFAMYDEE